jgi:hypothetical protein
LFARNDYFRVVKGRRRQETRQVLQKFNKSREDDIFWESDGGKGKQDVHVYTIDSSTSTKRS